MHSLAPHPALPPVKYQITAAPAAPTAPSQEALSRAVCWPCLHTDPGSRSLRLAQTLEQCSRAGWWLLSRAGSHVTQPRSFPSRLSGSAPVDTVSHTVVLSCPHPGSDLGDRVTYRGQVSLQVLWGRGSGLSMCQ